MPQKDLLEELDFHLGVIEDCKVESNIGIGILASFPGLRCPYVYPRDSMAVSKALKGLAGFKEFHKRALTLLEGQASFLLNTQGEDGLWGQRYGMEGEDRSIYIHEDNIAHSINILSN